MAEIRTEYLFTIKIDVEIPLQMLGKTPYGERRIAKILGGSFAGDRLKGTVLPGGGDWLLHRADDVTQLDVRLTLQTDDAALIYMTYRGMRHGPAAVIDRLNRGEAVDPSEYYFRIAPLFETSADKYQWINKLIAVGSGRRLPQGPVYEIFQVL